MARESKLPKQVTSLMHPGAKRTNIRMARHQPVLATVTYTIYPNDPYGAGLDGPIFFCVGRRAPPKSPSPVE